MTWYFEMQNLQQKSETTILGNRTEPLLFSTLCVGWCLTSVVRGGVCCNCTVRLTGWWCWPGNFLYDVTPAAIGGAFRTLGAIANISRNLVAYLACLIVVAPYLGLKLGGPADSRAAGLAEAHAEVVLWVLKKVNDAEYYGYIKHKRVQWSDLFVASQKERCKEVDEDGGGGGAFGEMPDVES